jgi:two-component system LytT family sensor kinase
MHPAVFIGLFILLGGLFALQEWSSMRLWGYHRAYLLTALEAWGVEYFLWGVLCWLLWRWFGPQIQRASLACIITRVLPASIVTSVAEEMIWVAFFPNLPLSHPHMDYWHRLSFELSGEMLDNMVIFWCAFGLFRAIGYYRKFRENEDTAAQLEVQLANAKISALQMQLNPHFLFNTMNSISSLMRTDIDAADTMLEQLGSLLRITLERGEAQFISLHDEMEFIELYLAMQDKRYVGRVQQSITIDPELYDALVPAMILQPIVENAYAHGLSKLVGSGILSIEAHTEDNRVRLSVLNSGIGLGADPGKRPGSQGLGLANTKGRLHLHYSEDQSFHICETDRDKVLVTLTFPLRLSQNSAESITRFGAQ